jgi:predicted Zn-dependent protease
MTGLPIPQQSVRRLARESVCQFLRPATLQPARRAAPSLAATRSGIITLFLAALTLACSTVPVTGRQSFNIVPDSQAEQLGADAYRQVLSESRLITSGPDYDRVVEVGRRIAQISDSPNLPWEFNLIDAPKTVNAFCLSGGKVAVYTGILPVAQSDAGLAVVVAHEIAHAIARHGQERMTDQLALQIGQAGLAELLGGNSVQTRNLVLAAFGAGAQVGVMLPFSRSQETEADHIGLVYMARAGYDPHEAPLFWRRMAAQSSGSQPPEFLSTHPAPADRIRQIEALIPEAMREYRPR